MNTEYYILSLKWSMAPPVGDLLVWWKPDNKGYTTRLGAAGRYTAEAVAADPSYYDNGTDTLAVPCAVAEAEVVRVVLNEPSLIRRFREAKEVSA